MQSFVLNAVIISLLLLCGCTYMYMCMYFVVYLELLQQVRVFYHYRFKELTHRDLLLSLSLPLSPSLSLSLSLSLSPPLSLSLFPSLSLSLPLPLYPSLLWVMCVLLAKLISHNYLMLVVIAESIVCYYIVCVPFKKPICNFQLLLITEMGEQTTHSKLLLLQPSLHTQE